MKTVVKIFRTKSFLFLIPFLLCNSISYGLFSQDLNYGDYYKGGIIFYLDESGRHGLVVSKENINDQERSLLNIMLWEGEQYTFNEAASIARKYRGGGFNDWFLPSINQLKMINLIRNYCEGLNYYSKSAKMVVWHAYWSSTEINSEEAYEFRFALGGYSTSMNKVVSAYVRAIRRF
jgi:hypothetical protein